LPVLLSAALAASCAGMNGDSTASGSGPLPADCIINRSVRNYTVLDDSNLIIYGPGRVPHHVVLTTPALDLSGEFSIGTLDRDEDGRLCPYGGDSILIDGILAERIPIRSIERIDENQAEVLQMEFGVIESSEDQFVVTPLE
jgi:hypothetical protein